MGKEAACESGTEREQAGPLPSVTWSPEFREELERVRSARSFCLVPPSASLVCECKPADPSYVAPKTGIAGQFGSRQQMVP